MYVEMRRLTFANRNGRFDVDAYVEGKSKGGTSFGYEAMKPQDFEEVVKSDKSGRFSAIVALGVNTKEFRQAVANMIINEPLAVATARTQYYIDQWSKAREGDPSIAHIEDRPEILATLYNLGPSRSIPKSNPGVGGSPNWEPPAYGGGIASALSGGTPFGVYAQRFIESKEAKELIKKICPCE
jgi:hypothetical protein